MITIKRDRATRADRRPWVGGLSTGLIAIAALLTGCHSVSPGTATASADNPEPGLSGGEIAGGAPMNFADPMTVIAGGGAFPSPYFHGVRLVGSSPGGGMQLGWIDHCAYVAGIGGIRVIDVSDPTHPRELEILHGRGADRAGENFDVREAPNGRRIIAAGYSYSAGPGSFAPDAPAYYDIFDATDCAHPKHVAEYTWPEQLHTSHISPNGMRIYGTRISPFSGNGGIHVLDIADMAHPRYVGKFGATAPDGRTWEFATHNVAISPDERRIYAGVISSLGGDFNDPPPDGNFTPARIGRDAGGIYIFDNSDIALGRPNPKLRLVGRADDAGWHDVTMANINGVPYLVAAGEMGACPGTWPRITNIADEAHPRIVGQFRLDMNREENCHANAAANTAARDSAKAGGMAGMAAMAASMSHASSHFSSVDSSTNTRLGLFNMTGAGLRIADLRDPANPVEVAYFRPGGMCTGFARYIPSTAQIWFTCSSGFFVVELTPEIRSLLRRSR